MRQRARIPAAALLAASAMLLAACGGESEPSPKGIEGAKKGGSETPSASPSAPAGRPSVELPDDLEMNFAWGGTGKPAENAVYRDAEQFFRGMKRASARNDLKDPAYLFYSKSGGTKYAATQIGLNIKENLAPTGKDRYFDGKVAIEGGTAGLVTCRDQSKVFSKNKKTNKVYRNAPDPKTSYSRYTLRLEKSSKGVWKVSYVYVTEGVKECMP
ncbi:hypothetical protein ACFYYR_28450 [Streptomyces sp. NPDC001922]|uniref:hypothetical protein n=1 Tax=Streptomyces sp. NPDC001922 TaxID=3364624 RepID=UPI0036C767E1